MCKVANDTQYHLLTCKKLSTPQPWNIESVVTALRQREEILDQEDREKKQAKKQPVKEPRIKKEPKSYQITSFDKDNLKMVISLSG